VQKYWQKVNETKAIPSGREADPAARILSPARDKNAPPLYQNVTGRKTFQKVIKLSLSESAQTCVGHRGAVMKPGKSIIVAALLLAFAAGNTAWAHGYGHHHHHGRGGVGLGIVIGAGLATASFATYPRYYSYPGYYYPPAYYYPAPVVFAQPAPPVYVEQPPQQPPLAAAPQQPGYWYYCNNPQGYYPSVQSCPQGWQKVLPQPSSYQ
jgi:hypothetical protein